MNHLGGILMEPLLMSSLSSLSSGNYWHNYMMPWTNMTSSSCHKWNAAMLDTMIQNMSVRYKTSVNLKLLKAKLWVKYCIWLAIHILHSLVCKPSLKSVIIESICPTIYSYCISTKYICVIHVICCTTDQYFMGSMHALILQKFQKSFNFVMWFFYLVDVASL